MKIKICGLTTLNDIKIVNKYLPDYVGFVFAKSKRNITIETAKRLKENLDSRILSVGVFVNEEIDTIRMLCDLKCIDIIQLHGDEDILYIKELKKYVLHPIIKAVRIQSLEQIINASLLPVEYLLFDTYIKDAYGGSGKTFDLNMLADAFNEMQGNSSLKYFLAGGIHSENFFHIWKEISKKCSIPYAIDVSSGVESNGKKDEYKVANMIQMVKRI